MWANHYWYVIGSIAKEIEKDKDKDEKLIEQTIRGICSYVPCEKCKKHFKEYVKKNPIDVTNLNTWINNYKKSTNQNVADINRLKILNRGFPQFDNTNSCCFNNRTIIIKKNDSLIKKIQSLKK